MYPLVRIDSNVLTSSQKDILCDCFYMWFSKGLTWKTVGNQTIFAVKLDDTHINFPEEYKMYHYIIGWIDRGSN